MCTNTNTHIIEDVDLRQRTVYDTYTLSRGAITYNFSREPTSPDDDRNGRQAKAQPKIVASAPSRHRNIQANMGQEPSQPMDLTRERRDVGAVSRGMGCDPD